MLTALPSQISEFCAQLTYGNMPAGLRDGTFLLLQTLLSWYNMHAEGTAQSADFSTTAAAPVAATRVNKKPER